MRIISAGIGDLGQTRSMQEMGAGAAGAAAGIATAGALDRAGTEHFKGTIDARKTEKEAAEAQAAGKMGQATDMAGDNSSQSLPTNEPNSPAKASNTTAL